MSKRTFNLVPFLILSLLNAAIPLARSAHAAEGGGIQGGGGDARVEMRIDEIRADLL